MPIYSMKTDIVLKNTEEDKYSPISNFSWNRSCNNTLEANCSFDALKNE